MGQPRTSKRNEPARAPVPVQGGQGRSERRLAVWIGAVVMAASFVAFWPAISGEFIGLDDVALLLNTNDYQGLRPANLAWMFSTTRMGHFQPLTWVTYAIDYELWGMDPRGYHVTNMVIHAINALLVFGLAARLVRIATGVLDRWTLVGAGVAALLFGVHPLRAESVAWITERRDVLSTMFLLLTTHAYLGAFRPGEAGVGSRRAYQVSVALLLLSLLSKAWGMSFFVVALILDVYPLRRLDPRPWKWLDRASRPVLLQKAPYAALGVIFAYLAGWAQSSAVDTVASLTRWGIMERAVQAVYGLMFYGWKTLWPTSLSPIYELPMRISPWEPRFVAAYVVVGAAALAMVVFRRRIPGVLAAAAVYVIILGPVLGILQSGIQLVADRYSYVACIGWAVLVGELVSRGLRGPGGPGSAPGTRAGIVLAAGTVCVAFGALTWQQSKVWQKTETVFLRPMELGTGGPSARTMYAKDLQARHKMSEALEQFRAVVATEPEYYIGWYTLGNFLRDTGQYAEAAAAYERAAKGVPEPWAPYVGLGEIYLVHLHQPEKAVEALRKAVADVERPDRPRGTLVGGGGTPHLMLAAALYETGDLEGCHAALVKAAEYPERRREALERLGEVEAEMAERRRGGP
jgi:protein O-mannosyl-transferase